jgi:hypothetical protein
MTFLSSKSQLSSFTFQSQKVLLGGKVFLSDELLAPFEIRHLKFDDGEEVPSGNEQMAKVDPEFKKLFSLLLTE